MKNMFLTLVCAMSVTFGTESLSAMETPRPSHQEMAQKILSEDIINSIIYKQITIFEATRGEQTFIAQMKTIESMGGPEAVLRHGKEVVARKGEAVPSDNSDKDNIANAVAQMNEGFEYYKKNGGFTQFFRDEKEHLMNLKDSCLLKENDSNRYKHIAESLLKIKDFGDRFQYRLPITLASILFADFGKLTLAMLAAANVGDFKEEDQSNQYVQAIRDITRYIIDQTRSDDDDDDDSDVDYE